MNDLNHGRLPARTDLHSTENPESVLCSSVCAFGASGSKPWSFPGGPEGWRLPGLTGPVAHWFFGGRKRALCGEERCCSEPDYDSSRRAVFGSCAVWLAQES